MKRVLLSCAAALGFALSSQAHSAAILYWADAVVGTDAMASALGSSGHSVTTSTSEADFAADVALGGWDLVIFMQQNISNPSAETAITSWVAGGGRAIFADWTRDSTLAASFDASYTGGVNQTTLNVTSASLAAGLATNPIALTNPGWGVFSMSQGTLPGGTSAGLFGDGTDAIVIGNGGSTIINGFLNDTFDGASFASGTQLYLNEIAFVLGSIQQVPEPGTLALLGLGLLGFAARRRALGA